MPDTRTTLHRAVMEALADNPRVHADEIVVEVLDDSGDIVLRGTVGGRVQRAAAMRTATGVPGVRHVEDGLEVRLMGIDGRADADTEAAVLDALGADDEVHARDVDVDVEDGAVTLRGLVEVAAQRDRAERIALAVPGVASVENKLRVWLTVSADDVAERVTDALGRDAILGRDSITVRVTGNDVALGGWVTSAAQHDAAVAAAEAAPGVARVHDEITVGDAGVR
jgi:osmotically-inducible protein OsmY